MIKLRPSSENEMVYEFLKMEISSSRYQSEILAVLKQLTLMKK